MSLFPGREALSDLIQALYSWRVCHNMKNFFISYNKADKEWSKWIDWVLRSQKYSTFVQFTDIPWGSNFVVGMDKGLKSAERVLLIVSPDSLESGFVEREWSVALAKDPDGTKGLLLPIKIRDCKPEGLLSVQVYLDIAAKDEATAAQIIKDGVAKLSLTPTGTEVTSDTRPYYPLWFDFAIEYVDSDQDWVNALVAKLEAQDKRVYRERWKIGDDGIPCRANEAPAGIAAECRVVCAGDATPANWAEDRIQRIQDLQDIQPNFRFVPVVLGNRILSLREHFTRVRYWADSSNAQGLLLSAPPAPAPVLTPVDEVTALEERTSRFLKFISAQGEHLDPAVRIQAQQDVLNTLKQAYVRR